MSDFVITKVLGTREWSPKDEPNKVFVYYDILFEGDRGRADDISKPASWKTLKGSPAPVEGETVDAEIVSKNGKVELKPVRRGGYSGGKGGGGKSPQERAEIRRLASHKVAAEVLGLQVQIASANGDMEKFKGKTPQELLGNLIAFFDEDAQKAGAAA